MVWEILAGAGYWISSVVGWLMIIGLVLMVGYVVLDRAEEMFLSYRDWKNARRRRRRRELK